MPYPSDIAAAIEDNIAEFLLSMGRAGGGEERADSDIAWTIGGSPIGYHNAVVRCCAATEDHARKLVEEWRAELRRRDLPGSWHLSPAMHPAHLDRLLVDAGFEDGGGEPAMAADLARLPDAPAHTDLDTHFEIENVQNDAQLAGLGDVLASGFGEGPVEADWTVATYRAIGLGDAVPWRHYLGRLDGEPVATASIFLTGDVAGIYFVCTRPAARRRGFGQAITRHVMLEARRLGCSCAVLGSSPMGQGVYTRLGFREVFQYRLFETEAGS